MIEFDWLRNRPVRLRVERYFTCCTYGCIRTQLVAVFLLKQRNEWSLPPERTSGPEMGRELNDRQFGVWFMVRSPAPRETSKPTAGWFVH
jgi:hypothetical protein